METDVKSWTDEAQKYLEGYLQQIEALITAKDVDAVEVVNDLRTHILNLAASQTGALVTVPELKRILATVGTPEDVADARAELTSEAKEKDMRESNQTSSAPWRPPVWTWVAAAAAVIVLLPLLTYLGAEKEAGPQPTASQPVRGEIPGRLLPGWSQAGTNHTDYITGYVPVVDGIPGEAMFIRSTAPAPQGFSTVSREIPADTFRGRRIALTCTIRSEGVTGQAGMWLRIDGVDGTALGFDNMQDRPIKGTSSASPYTITMDVSPEAAKLAYGVLLEGAGAVWFSDLKLNPEKQASVEAVPESSYSDDFIHSHSTDYFFARMAEPESGYHAFAGLWALTRLAASAGITTREIIVRRALELAQDSRNSFNQRFQCCYVASAFEDVRTIPYLEQILVTDPNPTLRGVAACALGYFESPQAGEALARALPNEHDPEARQWIERALAGEFPRPKLPPPGSGHAA